MELHLLLFILSFSCTVLLLVRRFTRQRKLDKLSSQYGCQPLLSHYPHKDPFFGLDLLFDSARHIKSHTFLERSMEKMLCYGSTHEARSVGEKVIHTSEPENLRAVYCRKFNDFAITKSRMLHFSTLLGESIFSTTGSAWKHSRAMIRPTFAKERAGDVELYETHFQRMLLLIPTDGRTVVDLQSLFFRFTMDLSTELFFGQSCNSLEPEVYAKGETRTFVDAYEAAKVRQIGTTNLGGANRFCSCTAFAIRRSIHCTGLGLSVSSAKP
jgi:hypothetical protein